MDRKIKDVYDFFSHNIRTFNAEIVTTIECLKVGFIDLKSDEFDIIYEAAYLLDLYDAGFNLALDFLSDNFLKGSSEDIDLENVTEEFLSHIPGYLETCGLKVEKIFKKSLLNINSFVFKNIYKIILYEIIKVTSGNLQIKIDENIAFYSSAIKEDYPKIFEIFAKILKNFDLSLTIGGNSVVMVKK